MMHSLRLRRKHRVALCYDELDMRNVYLCSLYEALDKAEIPYSDIHRHVCPGQPWMAAMEQIVTSAVWVVYLYTRNSSLSPDTAIFERIASYVSSTSKLRNIIIFGHQNIMTMIPTTLCCISKSFEITDNDNWVSELIKEIRKKPDILDNRQLCLHVGQDVELCSTDYLYYSDPGEVHSSDDENRDVSYIRRANTIRSRMRRKRVYMRKLLAPTTTVGVLEQKSQLTSLVFQQTNVISSFLEEWAWNKFLMVDIIDAGSSREDFTICISTQELRVRLDPVQIVVMDNNLRENIMTESVYRNMINTEEFNPFVCSRALTNGVKVKLEKGFLQGEFQLDMPENISNLPKAIAIRQPETEDTDSANYEFNEAFRAGPCSTTTLSASATYLDIRWRFVANGELSGSVSTAIFDKSNKCVMSLCPRIDHVFKRVQPPGITLQGQRVTWEVCGEITECGRCSTQTCTVLEL